MSQKIWDKILERARVKIYRKPKSLVHTDYASKIESRVILINGAQLAGLMIDYGIGVSEDQTYVIKRIDSDYFQEE